MLFRSSMIEARSIAPQTPATHRLIARSPCDLRLLVEIMPTIDLLSEEVTQLLTEELDFLAEESDAGVPNKLPLGEAHTRIVVSIPVEVWRDAAAAAISAAEQLNLDAESTR